MSSKFRHRERTDYTRYMLQAVLWMGGMVLGLNAWVITQI